MSVDSLVQQYLDCLKTEGKSPYTRRWHRASLVEAMLKRSR